MVWDMMWGVRGCKGGRVLSRYWIVDGRWGEVRGRRGAMTGEGNGS